MAPRQMHKPRPKKSPETDFMEPGGAVVLPPHYGRFEIEPIHFAQANKLSPLQAKVIKYICRYPFKNGIEDLHKARRCVDMLIDFEMKIPDWWLPRERRRSTQT